MQAWEMAPQWRLGQVINYLLNFCTTSELYNVSDTEIEKACDAILEERDRQAKGSFYTKALLFSKLFDAKKPDNYFEIARQILIKEEYELVVDGIIDPDIYRFLPTDLKLVVDLYFEGANA